MIPSADSICKSKRDVRDGQNDHLCHDLEQRNIDVLTYIRFGPVLHLAEELW